MTRALLLIALPLPVSAAILGARWMLRCKHAHEVIHFADVGGVNPPRLLPGVAGLPPALGSKMARVSPSGNAGERGESHVESARAMLYCPDCRRLRPHPWAGEPARFHRTQEARPDPITGIERAQAEAAEQALAIEQYEHEMHVYVMGEHTTRKFEGRG